MPFLLYKRQASGDSIRGKRLREILQLSGGPDGGDWKWETPAMNLGATVVSPALLQN